MKVSTTSPVLDVRANLQGSFSTFSSRQRQLTYNKLKHIHNSKRWKQPKYPPNDEKISKILYVVKMEYYSALLREVLTYTATWMDIRNMLMQ
jgi:hypothetical protein